MALINRGKLKKLSEVEAGVIVELDNGTWLFVTEYFSGGSRDCYTFGTGEMAHLKDGDNTRVRVVAFYDDDDNEE